MSIIDTLITDRTQSDVTRWRTLRDKGWAGMTADEKAEWSAGMKGAYNATDLNRVIAAMDTLNTEMKKYGYETGYRKVEVPHNPLPPKLPADYTGLEFIEGTGTQYIDTGIKPEENISINLTFSLIAEPVGETAILGAEWSNSGFFLSYIPGSFVRWHNGGWVDIALSSINQLNLVKIAAGSIDLNGERKTFIPTTMYPNTSIFIFATGDGAGEIWRGHLKLYSCKIFSNNEIKREYIPSKNPHGEVGLYDAVSQRFFPNAGTGAFVAGPPKEIEPPEDTRDHYTWYKEDIPTTALMAAYLDNVAAIRSMMSNIPVYPSGWQAPPKSPETIQHLTYEQANDIERILTDINDLLVWVSNNLVWVFAGDVYAGEW